MMNTLTIVYDAGCELCTRCRSWMETQPAFVTLDFVPADSPAASERFGTIPWAGTELVVVSDDGRVWAGAAAFLVCLWALQDWREWSYRLSSRTFSPLAERFFRVLSAKRRRITALFGHEPCGSEVCHSPRYGPYR
jgi:predicted DCC family thiol-disulfide oxidoreductase YuxK